MSAVRKSVSTRLRREHLQWQAVTKGLSFTEAGVPVLTLLVSGTMLDSSASVQNGIPVLGDKMTPDFLQTMCAQAQAGMVYLLENHSATLRMGISVDATLVAEEDGNQSLYVDFELFVDNPNVAAFIRDYQERGYQPQCSVGVFAARDVVWDADAGGYVGMMVEGMFEHVALTRPNHAAYAPARIEAMHAAGKVREAIGQALKTLPPIPTMTLQRLEKQRKSVFTPHRGAQGEHTMAKDTGPANGIRIKPAPKTELVTKEAEAAAAAVVKEDAAPEPEKKDDATKEAGEAEMCKECGKSKEDCKCKEAAAPAEAPAAAPAEKEADAADADNDGDTAPEVAETLENHVAAIKDMIESGGNPKDLMDYVQSDLLPDLEAACTALGGDPDEGDGEQKEDTKEDEDAKAPPPADDAPAKKDPPAEEPAKKDPPVAPEKKEDAALVAKEKPATPASPADRRTAARLTLKERNASRNDSALLREVKKLVEKSEQNEKKIEGMSELLKHLDSDEPATSRARRYDGGSETGDSETNLPELLKSVKDPRAREELSARLSTMVIDQLRGRK